MTSHNIGLTTTSLPPDNLSTTANPIENLHPTKLTELKAKLDEVQNSGASPLPQVSSAVANSVMDPKIAYNMRSSSDVSQTYYSGTPITPSSSSNSTSAGTASTSLTQLKTQAANVATQMGLSPSSDLSQILGQASQGVDSPALQQQDFQDMSQKLQAIENLFNTIFSSENSTINTIINNIR